jgi:hypothetical protein
MKRTLFQKIQIFFIELSAKVKWRQTRHLDEADIAALKTKFVTDHYIIATRKGNYLTTYLIGFGNWLLGGRFGRFSHVLMNLEDEVNSSSDFRFIEATGQGTHYSTFEQVFGGVDRVALVAPKHITVAQWTAALDSIKVYLGVPYDNLFDLKSTLEINCVELIRLALQKTPNYMVNFAQFEELCQRKKKLTPEMFIECADFEVVFEIKKK